MSHLSARLMSFASATVGLALLAGSLGSPVARAAEPMVTAAPVKTATLQQLLDSAAVVKPIVTGYSPYKFITIAQRNKKDRLGCNLNRQLLIKAASVKPRVAKGCKITGGVWMANGASTRVTDWRKIGLAPMMPFKQAWGLGAYAWTPAQRYAWATNVLAPARTRAVGVTPLQATNQIYLASDLKKILNAGIAESVFRNLLSKSGNTPSDFAFILSFIARYGNGDALLQSWAQYLTNEKACTIAIPATEAILTNTQGWGLGISPDTRLALDRSVGTCHEQQDDSASYYAYTALNKINPIPPNTVVPDQASSISTGDGLKIYSNYGTPVTQPVSATLFGLHAPPDTGSAPSVKYGYLRLWDSAVSWADLNPSRGVYNWTKLKEALNSPIAQGRDVMYVLGNTPPWAGDKSPNSVPSDMQYVKDFITALCGQAGGRITSIEAWNEGNLDTFWKGSPAQLADLTQAVKQSAGACHDNVVAASTGTRAEGAFVTRYDAYLKELSKRQWPIDGYAVHSYPSASGGPTERLDGVTQFKTMLAVNGAPVKPIYDSEVNFGLAGLQQNHIDLDQTTSGAYISRTFIDSVRYGIDHVFWFLWTPDYYNKLGIQLNPNTPYQRIAWDLTYGWLVGSRMQRCSDASPASDPSTVVTLCQLTAQNGSNMTLAWTNGKTVQLDATGLGNDWYGSNGDGGRIGGKPVAVGLSPIQIR